MNKKRKIVLKETFGSNQRMFEVKKLINVTEPSIKERLTQEQVIGLMHDCEVEIQ